MSWLPEQAGNGLDRVYYSLIQHLPRVGVQVRGLVAGSPQVAQSSSQTVHAFASDRAPLWRRICGLRAAMRTQVHLHQFDVIASHFALYTFPILDLFQDKPLVFHFHGPWASEGRIEGERAFVVRAKAMLERAVYGRAVQFIVLSRAFQRVLAEDYEVPETRIHVIPGGVEVERFNTRLSRADARHCVGWPLDRPIVLAVRRLARRMGLENLIAAMHLVRESVPDVQLYIAGRGPLANELQARIGEAGLTRHVRLLGFVAEKDLPCAYRAADLSVVPTVALEGFGLITIESLAAGTPVLVTPVGGLPEVVQGLCPDMVFPGTEVEVLGEHVTAALRGGLELPSSDRCQAYARAHFDWPVIAARTREAYKEILS